MRRVIIGVAIAALLMVGALCFLVLHFFDLSVYQASYMRTFTARETRRLRKEKEDLPAPESEDEINKLLDDLNEKKSNQNPKNSDEENS